jgi:hypothetical protein
MGFELTILIVLIDHSNRSTKALMDSLQQMMTSIIEESTMQMILGIVDNSADMAKH